MPRTVLNVAEKPSVARQVSQILASGPLVRRPGPCKFNPISEFQCKLGTEELKMIFTSVRGHLMEIQFPAEFSNWLTVSPASLLTAPVHREVASANKDLEKMLKSLSREATDLVLWLDCDREGEAIAFEVAEVCSAANRSIRISRATFSAVTQQDIMHAFNTLHPPDPRLADAVAARQELDLKIGASLTRLMTIRFKRQFELPTSVISYGPCQFPTLGFVVARYMAIRNFVPENFWMLKLSLKDEASMSEPLDFFNWKRCRLFDKVLAMALYQRCLLTDTATVVKVESKETLKKKPLPLNTIAMAKLAAKFLRLPAHHTMTLAESLYSQGVLSYPRTETDAFPSTMNIVELVETHVHHPVWGPFATGLLNNGGFEAPRGGSHNDAAHPPIHPVKSCSSEALKSSEEWNLYQLICKHFLAVCSKDAIGIETSIEVAVDTEQFGCKGLVIKEMNYLKIWGEYEPWKNARVLPTLVSGSRLPIHALLLESGQTSPPQLLSEVELITRMDKFGVGTDATMHEHVRMIQTRQYVERFKSGGADRFKPTVLGLALYRGYQRCSRELTRPEIRANTERSIQAIATGTLTRAQVLDDEIIKYRQLVSTVGVNLSSMENALKIHFPLKSR